MAQIIVSGYMIRHPVAGNVWAFFNYVLGLHLLGHKVIYLEESGWHHSCYNPFTFEWQDDPQVGISVVQSLMDQCGIQIPIYYVNRESGYVTGGKSEDIRHALSTADLLLNIGGVCWLPEFRLARCRALIDMDPFFTQIGRFGAEGFDEYHYYFSYGCNIGKDICTIPTSGVMWHPTVPPVVPEIWEKAQPTNDAPFTTIANWNAYGTATYLGEEYGQKNEEFLRLLNLPQNVSQKLELALAGANHEEVERLREAGWYVRNAAEVGINLGDYKKYINNSRGEFSPAKNAYVKTNSGWFSDRSVCYLAAGLPVIIQETGFSNWLPTGLGVLSFSSEGEAKECLEKVNAEYTKHCQSALEIANRFFNYQVVLSQILNKTLNT